MPLDPKLESKLQALAEQAAELSRSLTAPEVTADMERYRKLTRSYAEIEPILERFGEYRKTEADLSGARELAGGDEPELAEMAGEEARELEQRLSGLEEQLTLMLLPSDPNDVRNVVLEVRAGTGGDEATLFAGELFRMYSRFAETQGWKVRTTHLSESSVGGVKEAIAIIEGERVYSRLKYESGVHRVQRVPETETQGRIHTSAVTVAVMPEADDVELEIDEDKDLRIDTFCSSGPGGQSVNTTQSAVRITHLETNLVVQCQDEKSWHKNKARAMQVLRSRLYDKMLSEQKEQEALLRRGMVGRGDRSEKIRTYNFPQNRVTDHRVGLTVHNLPAILDGDIAALTDAVAAQDQAERLRQETKV